MNASAVLAVGAILNCVLSFWLLKVTIQARRHERGWGAIEAMANQVNLVSISGADYVKHIVSCDTCKRSSEPCPIGKMLHGAFEEQDKALEGMIHV